MGDINNDIKSILNRLSDIICEKFLAQEEEIARLKREVEQLKAERSHIEEEEDNDNDIFSLDSDEPVFEVKEITTSQKRKPILAELFSDNDSIAGNAMKSAYAWMSDIPGSKVDDIAKAVTLNDKMLFIKELFYGDEEQFDLSVERINETATFKEVVNDMRAAFPEWDESSGTVYRFYMIVRRKFRD